MSFRITELSEIQGKRNRRSMVPISSSDGALSPGFRRLTNAAHCCFFCGSFRNSSVKANGMALGTAVPRLSNEANIAFLKDAMANVHVLAMNQMS